MNRNKSIQFKAAFLLIVFSLNTAIGFACAVGMDMGFKSSHHHEDSTIEVRENHHHDKSHHGEEDFHHHQTDNNKDNCCKDAVMKFQQVDKNIATSFSLINPLFFTSFPASFYNIDILSSKNRLSEIKYFAK